MTQLTNLRVFNEARNNIRACAKLCERTRGFGDLNNQAKRAAVSVVSNIAEGLGHGSKRQNIKFFHIATRIKPRTTCTSTHHQRSEPTPR